MTKFYYKIIMTVG